MRVLREVAQSCHIDHTQCSQKQMNMEGVTDLGLEGSILPDLLHSTVTARTVARAVGASCLEQELRC